MHIFTYASIYISLHLTTFESMHIYNLYSAFSAAGARFVFTRHYPDRMI